MWIIIGSLYFEWEGPTDNYGQGPTDNYGQGPTDPIIVVPRSGQL